MSAIAMSTAGVTVNYAVEATAGTRPTTGYIKIPSIKSVPEMNPSPETLETAWATLVEAYKTGKEENKAVWFEIKHPALEKSGCFTGQPITMTMDTLNTLFEDSTAKNAIKWKANF